MTWRWISQVPRSPSSAQAAAPLWHTDGSSAGWLAVWPPSDDGPEGAAKIDGRILSADGLAASISYVHDATGAGVPFDDPAVTHAIRRVLLMPPADAISTLLVGDDRFLGAITVARDGHTGRLDVDPFANIFPSQRLDIGPGLFGSAPPSVGPSLQRYGSAEPWPWDRFVQAHG